MIGVRRVDYAQKQRILTYDFTKQEKPKRHRPKRNRPVSIVLNQGNQVDFDIASTAPSNPFLSAFVKADGNEDKRPASLLNWSNYPDEAVSPLISYFGSLDAKCLIGTVTGSTMLLTLKAAHDLNSFEAQIILTKAIYSVLKEETFDLLLETLIYSRVHRLNHLLLLLDCDICDNFAVVAFRPYLDRLTIGDLCTWLQTSSHLKLSSVDYLRYANRAETSFSIYECGEGSISALVTSWLRYDAKSRIEYLPELLKLVRWNSLTRSFDQMMAIDEVRNCKWARRMVKRKLSTRTTKSERPRCGRLTLALLGPDLFKPKYLRDVLSRLNEDDRKRSSFLNRNEAMIRHFFDDYERRPSCMYIALPVDVRIPPNTKSVVYENSVLFVTSSGRSCWLIVYRYDTTTGRVEMLPSPKFYRADNFSVTVVDGNLLVVGGVDKQNNVVVDIERLNLNESSHLRWTGIPRIPLLKTWWKQTCSSYQGKLFCWLISSTGLNVTYLFNFDTEDWTPAISTWQTCIDEMPDISSSIVSLDHGRCIVCLVDRSLYAFDLIHNDMIRVQLPRSSERDVVFDGGFYRYNVDDTGTIDTLLLIDPKQFDILKQYLTERDTCHTLFENSLSFLDIVDSISIPYLPDSCVVEALEIDVNRDMYCKLDPMTRSNVPRRIMEALRQHVSCT
jgi:hypothetical protein